MNRKYVIVSSKVESALQESLPDTELLLFRSISDLNDYTATTPIRALHLYVTQEVLEPAVGKSMEWLIEIIDHPFLAIDKIYFIVSPDEGVGKAIAHIKETQNNRSNWTIITGPLTRTYVNNVIIGNQKIDEFKPKKKAIFRQRRSAYVRENLNKQIELNDEYEIEEQSLIEVPNQPENTKSIFKDVNSICKPHRVTGLDSTERTVFTWMLSQYLALTGKTVIVEKDIEFLRLGDLITKSRKDVTLINVDNLFTDITATLDKIKKSKTNLVAVITNHKNDYSYNFIINMLYNNLSNDITNIVIENDFEEITNKNDYTVVLPAHIVGILKTVDKLPYQHIRQFKYVSLDMMDIDGLSITDSLKLTALVVDLTQSERVSRIPIFKINSLKLGSELNEIYMFT